MSEGTRKTLLLVEDEALLAMTEKMQLEKYGYAVKTVLTGEQAVDAVKTMPEIDLVLMDINLGDGIDGTQAAESILKEHDIPIVFVSSHSEREVVEKTEKITSYGYVVKNSSITVLDASIKMAFKLFEEKKIRGEKEESLRIKEDRLSKIMIAANDGMWDWNIITNHVYFDPRYYQMSGYEVDEFPHLLDEFVKRVHPSDRDSVLGQAQDHLSGRSDRFDVQFRFRLKSGEWQWIQGKGIIVERDVEGNPLRFIGTHRDISNSKLLEIALQAKNEEYEAVNFKLNSTTEKLREQNDKLRESRDQLVKSEERFKYAMNASNDGLWDWNVETNDIYFSPRWKRMLGYEDHEIPNDFSFWEKATDPEGVRKTWVLQEKLITKQIERFVVEFKMKHKDGHWVEVLSQAKAIFDSNGKAIRIVGTHTDISERKKAEETLRETKERLNFALEVSGLGEWELDLKTNSVKRNERWAEMLGYSLAEVDDSFKHGVDLQHPDDREAVQKAVKDHHEGRTDSFKINYRMKTKSGSYKWIQDCGKIYKRDADGRPIRICGTHADIDEQKKAEEKLQESVDKFNLLMNSVSEGIYGVDEHENCTFCNDSCLKLLGYTHQEELIGKNMHWFMHGKHFDGSVYPIEDCPIAQNFRKGIGIHIDDEVFWRSDGTFFHAEYWSNPQLEDGTVVGAVMSFIDITERRKIENDLRQMSLILENVDSIAVLKDSSLRYLTVNKAYLGLTGLQSITALIGKTDKELFKGIATEEQIAAYMENDRIALELPEGQTLTVEESLPAEDGNIRTFLTKKFPIYNRKSQIVEAVATLTTEITERKAIEEKINVLLAEKELLLKEVHHRIKNNMNTISSLLSLQASFISEPSAIKALDDAENRIQSMGILYDKLYCAVDFMEVSVKEYLIELASEVVTNFPNSQNVKIKENLEEFMLDAKRVQSVGIIINELLTNIMKYAFKGRESGLIVVSATKTDDHVAISVEDDGIGMPETITFENSTGFGLQLVQALTQQLNGTIRMERGNGTKILLEFDV